MKKEISLSKKSGLTLVEVLISTSIFGLLAVALASFNLFSIATQKDTTGKLLISRDIRVFTQDLAREARGASFWALYDNITNGTRIVEDEATGDVAIFFYDNFDATKNDFVTYRVVGYLRSAEPGKEGPVIKFTESGKWDSSADYALPTLVNGTLVSNNKDSSIKQETVVELASGLADGQFFYNFAEREALIIRGEIQQEGGRLRNISGEESRSVVNTYNFTVFPRI